MSAVRSDDLVRAPHPRLRPFVGDYVGYDIAGVPAGTHLGLPSAALTFIVAIDEPLRQVDPATGESEHFDVLLAGLHLRPTFIRHSGTMAGIQINFGPFAPRALFGVPAADFVHRTYDLGVVSRPLAAELHDRVNGEQSWSGRFAAIDQVLIRCLSDRQAPRAEVVESWRQIAAGRGELPVSLIADHIGWSRRHLTAQFRFEVGIGPKDVSRVLRFDRARRLIAAGNVPLADIAAACGYADQSHLNRDFRALAGTNPRGWLRGDDVARLSAFDDSASDDDATRTASV